MSEFMKTFNRRSFFIKTSSLAPVLFMSPEKIFNKVNFSRSRDAKLKLSLNAYSFNSLLNKGEMDLFQLLEFCASHNLDAVEPTGYYFPRYPDKPDDDFISKFKRKAHLLGLSISGTGTRNDFITPDVSARKKDIEHVKEWVEVSAKLGAPLLRVFAGREVPSGYTRNDANQWLAEGLSEVADYGRRHGVLIALQNHNHFIKSADQIIEVMKLVNHDWLRLNLDIGSLRQGNPYEEIAKVVGYAITWQIKELVYFNGVPQKTDLTKLFQIIKDAGYRGYLPLETLGEGDPYKKVSALIEEARGALSAIDYKY
jgi:sugar phosphate isomerase/epimerase